MNQYPLTIEMILKWADAHRHVTGRWPNRGTGGIPGTIGELWYSVDSALRYGKRGLPGGSSLSRLLAEKRRVRNIHELPPLTEDQILQWADIHFHRTGSWPTIKSGKILETGEKWQAVNTALRIGIRSLPGGSSLPRLLSLHRGVRNRKNLPVLTEETILAWADRHRERTGSWPISKSGPIADAPGETWMAVEMALSHGQRGLPGGTSLAMLLAQTREVQNLWTKPNLTVEKILAWADATYAETGKWPTIKSGRVIGAPEETWQAISQALKRGKRGLPGGFSLAELMAVERGVRNLRSIPPFSRRRILSWADSFFRRHGKWPMIDSGPIPEAPDETWGRVHNALVQGNRGLRGGSSLPMFLAAHRGKRHPQALPPLSFKKILDWADKHFQRNGKWPSSSSGDVHDVPGEKWNAIDQAIRQGYRGLPGGSSLHQLFVKKRGVKSNRYEGTGKREEPWEIVESR